MVFRFSSAQDIDNEFIEAIKAKFQSKTITIRVEEELVSDSTLHDPEVLYAIEKHQDMKTETQIRSQIIKQISKIPSDKLMELSEFVSKLDVSISHKNKTLSFAGAWGDIDNKTFEILTDDLISNRAKNRRRNNE